MSNPRRDGVVIGSGHVSRGVESSYMTNIVFIRHRQSSSPHRADFVEFN